MGGSLKHAPLSRQLIDDPQTPPAGLVRCLLAHRRCLIAPLVDDLDAQETLYELEPKLDHALTVLERVGHQLAGHQLRRLAGLHGGRIFAEQACDELPPPSGRGAITGQLHMVLCPGHSSETVHSFNAPRYVG